MPKKSTLPKATDLKPIPNLSYHELITPGSPGKFLMAAFVRPYAQRVTAEICPVQPIVRAYSRHAERALVRAAHTWDMVVLPSLADDTAATPFSVSWYPDPFFSTMPVPMSHFRDDCISL
jgi:hypothetical protein